MAEETPKNAASIRKASSRTLSKKAAKAYVLAMKKAGEEVPHGYRDWPSRPVDDECFTGSGIWNAGHRCDAKLLRPSLRRIEPRSSATGVVTTVKDLSVGGLRSIAPLAKIFSVPLWK